MKNRISKTIVLTLISITSLFGPARGQTYNDWTAKAKEGIDSKNHNEILAAFSNAFKIHKGLPEDLYNAACAAAQLSQHDTAFFFLEDAIHQGYIDSTHLVSDPDLQGLHHEAKWPTILKLIVEQNRLVNNNPLTAELEDIRTKDQSQRMLLISSKPTDSLIKAIQEQDKLNQERVKEIIDKWGWLGPSEIGGLASSAIFLVIQHASLSDQKKYINLLKEAVDRGQAKAEDLALMEDRIAIREGRKQTYGSQIGLDRESNTKYVFPLADPEKIDQLRHSVGLIPMSDYLAIMNLQWDYADYIKNEDHYIQYHKNFINQKKLQ